MMMMMMMTMMMTMIMVIIKFTEFIIYFTVAPASRIHATINSWHSALAFHHDVQLHCPRHQRLRPLQIKFHLRQIGNILICGEVHGGIDQTWKRFNMSCFIGVTKRCTRLNLVSSQDLGPFITASGCWQGTHKHEQKVRATIIHLRISGCFLRQTIPRKMKRSKNKNHVAQQDRYTTLAEERANRIPRLLDIGGSYAVWTCPNYLPLC